MQKKQRVIERVLGHEEDYIYNLPIKISYERPDLEEIMIKTAVKSSFLGNKHQEVSVYSCAPHSFNRNLQKICKKAKQHLPEYSFELYPEVFS